MTVLIDKSGSNKLDFQKFLKYITSKYSVLLTLWLWLLLLLSIGLTENLLTFLDFHFYLFIFSSLCPSSALATLHPEAYANGCLCWSRQSCLLNRTLENSNNIRPSQYCSFLSIYTLYKAIVSDDTSISSIIWTDINLL